VRARVLDVAGRLVDEVLLTRGDLGFTGSWDARDVAPGVYFLSVNAARAEVRGRIVRVE
jgi:hypothetical protein